MSAWIDPKRLPSGAYRVRWYDPQHRQRSKTFKRQEDARGFRFDIGQRLNEGTYLDPARGRITFGEFFDGFMERARLEPSTMSLYRLHGRLYLIPAFGHRRLNTITREDVEAFVTSLERRGIGAATIRACHRLLHRVLSQAVKAGRIGSNPAADLDGLPRVERRKARFLSADEVGRLVEACPDRDRALVLTLSYCGLRIGEAVALRVKHVDLMRGRLHVAGAVKEVEGRLIEGSTKTDRERTVALPAFLRDALAERLASYSNPSDPESLVFPSAEGKMLRVSNWRRRVFERAVEAAGIAPPPHVHDLRHTAASLAIMAGAHPKAVSEMLGHSSITITLDLYGHMMPGLQEATASELDRIFRAAQAPAAAQVVALDA